MNQAFTWIDERMLDDFCYHKLLAAGITFPPADAFQLATSLGFEVVFDAQHTQRASCVRLRHGPGGCPLIILNPRDRLERLHWAVAHELGEFLAADALKVVGISITDITPPEREWLANQLAKRLLVPRDSFLAEARRTNWDLVALKERFATASHEVLARRMLDFPPFVIITIIDHRSVSFRRSSGWTAAPPLSGVERTAWFRAHTTCAPQREEVGGEIVQVWAIHEPHWKREILRTELPWVEG